MVKEISLTPPSSVSLAEFTSTCQPRFSAYMVYIRVREWANRADSSPPTPARISMITFLPSLGSFGRRSTLISRSSRSMSDLAWASSCWASSRISGSESNSSASAKSDCALRSAR